MIFNVSKITMYRNNSICVFFFPKMLNTKNKKVVSNDVLHVLENYTLTTLDCQG